MSLPKRVLFLCTHNSARSQMAEGLLRAMYGDRYEVYSAGTEPTSVHPCACKVMAEIGVDISHHTSKSVAIFWGEQFDYVVTLCDDANQACPVFPNADRYIHRAFLDPSSIVGSEEEMLSAFRGVRDEIKAWIVEVFGDDKAILSGASPEGT